ncbi:hypothetical protein BDF22DRAFT_667822 [Syncephalis plumigaleata]|nr:hypothetical protein BDF22DRAFT_667822 [Syncephalis plumigaleata]
MFASSIRSFSASYLAYSIVIITILSHFIECILSQQVVPTKNNQNTAPNTAILSRNCNNALKSTTAGFPCWTALREQGGKFMESMVCPILHNSTICSRERVVGAIKNLDHYCRNELKHNEPVTTTEYAFLHHNLIGYDVCVKKNTFQYCELLSEQQIINDNRCNKCLQIVSDNFLKRKPLTLATPVNDSDYSHFLYNSKQMAEACTKVKSNPPVMANASSIASNGSTSIRVHSLDIIVLPILSILAIRMTYV